MPRVNGREFPYTPKGVAEAKAYAKKTGMPMEMPPAAAKAMAKAKKK